MKPKSVTITAVEKMSKSTQALFPAAKENLALSFSSLIAEEHEIRADFEPVKQGFQLQYENPNGRLYQGHSFDWLESLDDASVDLVFVDPPYNIKKADWDNFDSQEKYIEWSIKWITQVSRALKATGSLYVCGFSEIPADLKHPASKYFKHCRWLIWHYKNKANLGSDWGRSHESIIHFRKSDASKLNIDDVPLRGAHAEISIPPASSAYGKGANKQRDNWTPHPKGAKPKLKSSSA